MYPLIVDPCVYFNADNLFRSRAIQTMRLHVLQMFPIHSFLLPYLLYFLLSLFPSDLQLGFLFFFARIIFSTTASSTTGSVNWCWQPEFNLQQRHLTEHSSRSVSDAKYNRKPKQFHHLVRIRSWNTKHSSTVNLIRRRREELSLWSGGTWVRDRGDVLACQGLKYASVLYGAGCTKWFMVQRTYLRLNTPVGWLSFHA